MKTFKVTSNNYPWDTNGYKPEIVYELSTLENAFAMHIIAYEEEPQSKETKHLNPVYMDSCVEWFVNFCPETSDWYFNYEINSLGTVDVNLRLDRYTKKDILLEEVESFKITPQIFDDRWEISFVVPFDFIKKYYPDFTYTKGMTLKGNFSKCGDGTKYPHFGTWCDIPTPEPDFHLSEYFKEFQVD